MRLFVGIILAAAFVSAPAAAQSVSIKDPAIFHSALKAMGYAPTELQKSDTAPEFDIVIDGFTTTLRLQGCTMGKQCKYMTLAATYSDVVDAPLAWVQKMNDEFDLLRVGIDDKGQLYMFGGHVIEGLPQSELRRIFNYWVADTAEIGAEATSAGHVTAK